MDFVFPQQPNGHDECMAVAPQGTWGHEPPPPPPQQNGYVVRELPPTRQHFMSGASSSSQQAAANKDIVRALLGYI